MFQLDSLENRRLFAYGAYPVLIGQDQAIANYPNVTGAGVNIALIDSGVDFSQPNLAGKFWTNPGEIANNGKDDDGDGYIDDTKGWDFYNNDNNPEDQNGHGTAMSGLIASAPFTFNNATYAGVAQGAKIIPLKVSDPSGAYNLTFAKNVEKALKWVETNYKKYNIGVVSMSIRTPLADYNATYADEIARLAADGVYLVAAGGQQDPNLDAEYPAADPNVLGVSVVKANNTFPTDTVNRGPGIDILAPGDAVPIILKGGGTTTSSTATSYSVPYVSATVALLKQVDPSLTNKQITNILVSTGASVKDTSTGYTFSGRTYARLNINAAIKAVIGTGSTDTAKPTASASAANVSTAGGTSYTFTVTYSDNTLVKTSTIDSADIKVTGPNGFSQSATLVSVDGSANAATRVATYRITPPGGSWNSADNGTYTIALQANQVTDTTGNAASAATLKTFNVGILGTSGTASISGIVYLDNNANGIKDSDDRQALVATLFIDTNQNAVLDAGEVSIMSNKKSGNYSFTNLAAGTYVVRQIPLKGYRTTSPTKSYVLTVSSGQALANINFAETTTGLIAGQVWNDTKANGAQNKGEVGLAGETVYLDANNNNQLDAGELSRVTDSNGYFTFNTLAPAKYVLRIQEDDGLTATTTPVYHVTIASGTAAKGLNFGRV